MRPANRMRAGSDRARRSVRIGKIMELTDIRELHREKDVYIGKEITVGGWVRNNRDSKNFGFLVINDGTFFEPLQVVYGDGLENFQEICKINVGAAVVIRGTIVATPEAKQAFEMQAAEVIVEGPSTADYPYRKETLLRVSAYHFSLKSTYQYFPGSVPCQIPDRLCNPYLLHGERLCLCAYPSDHQQ